MGGLHSMGFFQKGSHFLQMKAGFSGIYFHARRERRSCKLLSNDENPSCLNTLEVNQLKVKPKPGRKKNDVLSFQLYAMCFKRGVFISFVHQSFVSKNRGVNYSKMSHTLFRKIPMRFHNTKNLKKFQKMSKIQKNLKKS